MSDTQQLFALAAVWTIASIFIARFISNWGGRIALVTLLVGVPFWELPYGLYNFQRLCKEEAKLLVFDKLDPQEMICADYPYVTLHSRLLDVGFKSVEVRGKTGGVTKYVKGPVGDISETKQADVSSRYCITFKNNNSQRWSVLRHDVLVIRNSDRAVVARQSRFDWSGMWWQVAARPLLGSGGTCSSDPNQALVALRKGAA